MEVSTSEEEEDFLRFLKEITRCRSLLIFDEVITGYRLSLGGAQQYYNIKPDIQHFGKIVGGRIPIECVWRKKREIMQIISQMGQFIRARNICQNPVTQQRQGETLNILKMIHQIYERLEQKTRKLAITAREAGKDIFVSIKIGSLMSVFLQTRKSEILKVL